MLDWPDPEQVAHFRRLERMGRRTPLRDLPQLSDYEWQVWDAFTVLNNSRAAGWGVAPIPVSEIVTTLDLFGVVDTDERLTWFQLIRALDDTLLSRLRQTEQPEDEPRHRTPRSGSRSYRGSPRRGNR